ncbi:AsnC family transcriptional regulator [Candidatus Bathyarchaeota archaeon]|nr:AsnC family transcriptional regulator [Candidatus Bathyarchaeota archaeon]
MKDVKLRLISELMKNSRRSDRELARAIGVSQPTITRLRAKLEGEGNILEYTVMPNFVKLGYHLFALTFINMKTAISPEEADKVRQIAQELAKKAPSNIVVIERGMGLGYTGVVGSFHKDYASYAELIEEIKRSPHLESKTESFLINLDDKIHYRHLTFRTLAEHLLTLKSTEK